MYLIDCHPREYRLSVTLLHADINRIILQKHMLLKLGGNKTIRLRHFLIRNVVQQIIKLLRRLHQLVSLLLIRCKRAFRLVNLHFPCGRLRSAPSLHISPAHLHLVRDDRSEVISLQLVFLVPYLSLQPYTLAVAYRILGCRLGTSGHRAVHHRRTGGQISVIVARSSKPSVP
ncbi:hypothetical protein D3C80_1467540 [compost metagenome]